MHAPDGFLTAGTAVATGVLGAGGIGVALQRSREFLQDRHIPLAGLMAAFVFSAQMVNFPVAAGTTGHLIGATLAAVLIGPHLAVVALAVVVGVQAFVFADGGLTALGYNTLNLAIIPAYGGYATYRLFTRLMPDTAAGVSAAAGLGGFASVVMSAAAFSLQWLFGASAPISFAEVFTAMVGVHVLIGLGEGVVTGMAVGAVLAARPDLVDGGRHAPAAPAMRGRRVTLRTAAVAVLLAALVVSAVVSQFAATGPDGLERVAEDIGIADQASPHALAGGIFADYATVGLENEEASLAVAGVSGTLIALAVASGIVLAARRPD